jgi:acyl-CoA reductase-like NAD-dependent aldehyde dehydrogenase
MYNNRKVKRMRYKFDNYVGGKPSGRDLPTMGIESMDGSLVIEVPDSGLPEIIAARDGVTRLSDASPRLRVSNSLRTIGERIAIVRSLFDGFRTRQDEIIDVVHEIHGTPKVYLRDSFSGLERWVNALELFVENANEFSLEQEGIPFAERRVLTPYAMVTAGNFEAYESFYVLAQTILSGTHLIVRPSAYDFATHVVFEIMAEKGLGDLGQKITWDSARQPELIRHLLRFVPGASIFGSDEQIKRMLKTSLLERYPDGRTEERVIEDISAGRKIRAYGSGNAMFVVMGDHEMAAEHFYYAKVLAKGNKCWVPDGAIVLKQYADAFCDKLLQLDMVNSDDRPKFRDAEIQGIATYIRNNVGSVNHGTFGKNDNSLGILLCRDLSPESPFFNQEVTFPAAGIIPVDDIYEAIGALRQIIARRKANAYLSLGYFGPEEDFTHLQLQIRSESYHVNDSLVVELIEPHQGSYFMLDPTVKPGGAK